MRHNGEKRSALCMKQYSREKWNTMIFEWWLTFRYFCVEINFCKKLKFQTKNNFPTLSMEKLRKLFLEILKVNKFLDAFQARNNKTMFFFILHLISDTVTKKSTKLSGHVDL